MNKSHIKGPIEGAILMSNAATKRECLRLGLFGLPPSMIRFIGQLKAGMLLFLFEFEERKLYGVFEATSDGSCNIMANAFSSLGYSFPAQILFKRIWMCQPLSEDEFCHSIKENYFAFNKFRFGLSYDQVVKLVQLFYIKRIDLKMQHRPGIPNQIITEFERCVMKNQNKWSGGGRYMMKFDSIALGVTDGNNMRSVRYKRPSLNDPPTNGNVHEHQVFGCHDYHGFGEGSSHTVGMNYPPLARKLVDYIETSVGSSVDRSSHLLNEQICAPHIAPSTLELPPNFMELSSTICQWSASSLPPATSEGHSDFPCYSELYDPSNINKIFLSPVVTSEKGATDCLSSVQPSSSHINSEAPRHLLDSAKQSPEYISLPGSSCSDKNVESSRQNNFCSYSSEHKENNEVQEEYPPVAESRLHSDTEHIRTSVFSRLSKGSEDCHVSRTPKVFSSAKSKKTSQNSEAQEPLTNLSMEQLERILSERREQLIEGTKLHKQSIIPEKAAKELIKVTSVELELTHDEHRHNYKRSKWLEPSLSEEHKRVKGSTKEITVNRENTSYFEASLSSNALHETEIYFDGLRNQQLAMENDSVSCLKTSSGEIGSEETYKCYGNLRSSRKEISHRNLRWFLKKYDVHATVSNVDPESQQGADNEHVPEEAVGVIITEL